MRAAGEEAKGEEGSAQGEYWEALKVDPGSQAGLTQILKAAREDAQAAYARAHMRPTRRHAGPH